MRPSLAALVLPALLALLAACAAPALPPGAPDRPDAGDYSRRPTGRLTFTFGGRTLDDAFAPTEEPFVFGVELSQVRPDAAVGYEVGFTFGQDSQGGAPLSGGGFGDLELLQSEFHAGLRTEIGDGPVHPYLGAGATWITNDTRVRTGGLEARESDGDLGAYAHAGLLLDLSRTVHVTLDGRAIFGTEYTVDGSSFDSDYAQVTLGVGFNF